MKTIILASTLVLIMTTALPVWGEDEQRPESSTQPTIETFHHKVILSIERIKVSRLQMAAEPNENQQKNLMLEHMQNMKDGMKIVEQEGRGSSAGLHYDRRILLMKGQVEMMMELMQSVISQQEMLMKNGI